MQFNENIQNLLNYIKNRNKKMTANWKVIDLLKKTDQYLRDKGIENPRLNAELLLGHTLNMSRVELYMAFERPLSIEELDDYREKIKRRSLHEPPQYIMGETEFMGFPFKVTRDVLIPRPETEILIETVLDMKAEITGTPIFLDIGTGSGCIPISLAKLWPQGIFYGTDISQLALKVAMGNAVLNELNTKLLVKADTEGMQPGDIAFVEHDIFQDWKEPLPRNITVLLSNPPYIAKDEMDSLSPEVKNYEPAISLTDNDNGMSFYTRLLEIASGNYFSGLQYLIIELSGSQHELIVDLAAQFKFSKINIRKDLNGIPRVLIIGV